MEGVKLSNKTHFRRRAFLCVFGIPDFVSFPILVSLQRGLNAGAIYQSNFDECDSFTSN